MPNFVTLNIDATPSSPAYNFSNVAWFPGMNVLDVLILADASVNDNFTFGILYGSQYGAYVSQMNGVSASGGNYWMLYINGQLASAGISESLILDPGWTVTFQYEVPPADHKQVLAFQAAEQKQNTGSA
jgi:hypothetical protein